MLRELALWLGPDSESGGIRCDALREILLQLLELSKEPVIFRVGYRRPIEDVVLVRCAGEYNPQLRGATKLKLLGPMRRL